MTIRFVKMHGCGNDYVYVDAINQPEVAAMIGSDEWRKLVVRMSDRHKGIGSDGVIAVCEPTAAGARARAQVRMRMFNADGGESEMCGNGVRCVAKFAHDRLGVRTTPMCVETGRGVLGIEYQVSDGRLTRATVDMGIPIDELRRIPVDPRSLERFENGIEWGLQIDNATLRVSFVSMGNPHAVMFVDNVDAYPLEEIGSRVERHAAFPSRINFHVAQAVDRDRRGRVREIKMRTWERGSGLTQACGTGACAVFFAASRMGWIGPQREPGPLRVHVPGGLLETDWRGGEGSPLTIALSGPAEDVFEGEYRG